MHVDCASDDKVFVANLDVGAEDELTGRRVVSVQTDLNGAVERLAS